MSMHDRSASLESFMRGFHLFRHGDWNGWVIGFRRQAPGDRDANDASVGH